MFKSLLPAIGKIRCSLPALPSQCAVCHSWPAQPVCKACVARFAPDAPRCRLCALPLPADLSAGLRTSPGLCVDCVRQPPPVDATLVAVNYGYPWARLVSAYKFGNKPGWAGFFASHFLTAPGVHCAFAALQPGDLVLPVPLSTARLESRGFNQAWQLASQLTSQSASLARADARLLLRVRSTQPQTELNRQARLDNVKHAFELDPLRAQEVAGRKIILVDDVMTSGATLFSAALTLKAAGAAHVTALAFARTPAP